MTSKCDDEDAPNAMYAIHVDDLICRGTFQFPPEENGETQSQDHQESIDGKKMTTSSAGQVPCEVGSQEVSRGAQPTKNRTERC